MRARLASGLMMAGDIDAAVREAETARSEAPTEPEAWVLVAAVFGRAERPRDALDCVMKARALGATDAGSYLTEALARLQLGDEAGGDAALREGLRRHPESRALKEMGDRHPFAP